MKITFNGCQGTERKPLVKAIEELIGRKGKYCMNGEMKYAYDFGDGLALHRDGTLIDEGNIFGLLTGLAERGFTGEVEKETADGMTLEEELGLGETRREDFQGENGMSANDIPETFTYQAELSDSDCPDRMEVFTAENDEDAVRQAREFCEGEVVLLELFQLDDDYNTVRGVELKPDRMTIQMPMTGFTPEKIDNLCKLVAAKEPLLKAALGAEALPIQQNGDTLDFPWFHFTEDSDTTNAYATLVERLCKTAMEKKRVTAKAREDEGSPKYRMRCFLLSLGFIGGEFKTARKILLANLEGNGSFASRTAYDEMQQKRRKTANVEVQDETAE
jgi:hypothetical protein